MLKLLATLLLCVPALAGTTTFSTSDNTLSLASDPAPPGATTLHIQLFTQVDFDIGFENRTTSGCPDFVMKSRHEISLVAGFTTIGADTVYSGPYAEPLSPFDGVIDFDGASGANHQWSATQTLAPWTYAGTPTSLTINRASWTTFQNIAGAGAGYQFNHSSGVAVWYWT